MASHFPEILRFKGPRVSPQIVVNFMENGIYKRRTSQISRYVYFISDGEYVKIGIAYNPATRIKELQIGNARKLDFLFTIPIYKPWGFMHDDAQDVESFLHKGFGENHIQGKWFDILHRIDVDEWKNTFGCGVGKVYY